MKIVTVGREFSSGGREVGKRLAEALGFDYYDWEIITAIAKKKNTDEDYVETLLSNQGAISAIPLTFRNSFANSIALNSMQVNMLLEQNKVLEDIAKLGRNFVIVGRNADVVLEKYKPFNIFVCADLEAKIRRLEERAKPEENLTRKKIIKKMKRIDKNRAKSRELLAASPWGAKETYHLILNTSDWKIKEIIPPLKQYITAYWERTK